MPAALIQHLVEPFPKLAILHPGPAVLTIEVGIEESSPQIEPVFFIASVPEAENGEIASVVEIVAK